MDGWADRRMNRWMDGWMDGWMNGWMDRWMDGWMTDLGTNRSVNVLIGMVKRWEVFECRLLRSCRNNEPVLPAWCCC